MSIFQKSVRNEYLKNLDETIVAQAYSRFQKNFNIVKIEEIKKLKEEEYQDGFLRDIFVDVFGYTFKPEENYNLAREYKNVSDSKKADGAILKNGNVIAVIELKSTKTKDLNSIKEQAFNYKNEHEGCKYVITSNFQKIRLYVEYSNEFEEFDLFDLSQDDFKTLYLLLNKESVFNDIPSEIKQKTIFREENISKQLYKDYSSFKKRLFENLVKNNPEQDKLTLFKKSQKLIDRFLFILFAEDRGLLPSNSISRIIQRFETLKNEDAYKPIYDIFKQYFGYMNVGREGKNPSDNIPAYNGGLFYEDDLLNKLIIDDNILKDDLKNLSVYDFNTDVDVNILGHIFEHSLSEIEEITAEIEGIEKDKSKSKRKKDGVFYTPKYITQYIVENTIGTLCTEKRKELNIFEIEFDESFLKKDRKLSKQGLELYEKLEEYKKWLLSLKIVDPACGSGAFLNQALNFLISEHQFVIDMETELQQGQGSLFSVETAILENNLYGVDINEESVEIAKLSLWLRTAQKGRKLSILSNNIKCGNSLIDDPEVAGEKAFNWEKEFPEVFAKGGFDVVIGNPPYVRVQFLKHKEIDWFKKHMEVAHKRIDISIMFLELGSKILSQYGLLAYITSNQFLNSEYGRKCRKLLLRDYKIEKIVHFGDLPIFEDALTYVSIFNLRKDKPSDFLFFKIDCMENAITGDYRNPFNVNISSLDDNVWILKNKKEEKILKKLQNLPSLDSVASCNYGIVTGNDFVFNLSDEMVNKNGIEKEILLPLIRANNCERYNDVKYDLHVLYPYELVNGKTQIINENVLKKKYPYAHAYLEQHKTKLMSRKDSRKTFENRESWFSLTRFGRIDLFNEMKIVFPGETKHHKFCIDKNKAGYSGARVFSITINKNNSNQFNIYCLLGIMNSTLIEFYLHSVAPLKQGGYYSYSSTVVNKTPLSYGNQLNSIGILSKLINENTAGLFELRSKLSSYLIKKVPAVEDNIKLKIWDNLDFGKFINELNKEIKKSGREKLTKMEEMEWMELFETKKAEVLKLREEIEKIDKEIDKMVYELYGLTPEEIEIVEGSFK